MFCGTGSHLLHTTSPTISKKQSLTKTKTSFPPILIEVHQQRPPESIFPNAGTAICVSAPKWFFFIAVIWASKLGHIYIYMYIYIHIYTYICIYIYTYIYIYISCLYIHIYLDYLSTCHPSTHLPSFSASGHASAMLAHHHLYNSVRKNTVHTSGLRATALVLWMIYCWFGWYGNSQLFFGWKHEKKLRVSMVWWQHMCTKKMATMDTQQRYSEPQSVAGIWRDQQ